MAFSRCTPYFRHNCCLKFKACSLKTRFKRGVHLFHTYWVPLCLENRPKIGVHLYHTYGVLLCFNHACIAPFLLLKSVFLDALQISLFTFHLWKVARIWYENEGLWRLSWQDVLLKNHTTYQQQKYWYHGGCAEVSILSMIIWFRSKMNAWWQSISHFS